MAETHQKIDGKFLQTIRPKAITTNTNKSTDNLFEGKTLKNNFRKLFNPLRLRLIPELMKQMMVVLIEIINLLLYLNECKWLRMEMFFNRNSQVRKHEHEYRISQSLINFFVLSLSAVWIEINEQIYAVELFSFVPCKCFFYCILFASLLLLAYRWIIFFCPECTGKYRNNRVTLIGHQYFVTIFSFSLSVCWSELQSVIEFLIHCHVRCLSFQFSVFDFPFFYTSLVFGHKIIAKCFLMSFVL